MASYVKDNILFVSGKDVEEVIQSLEEALKVLFLSGLQII